MGDRGEKQIMHVNLFIVQIKFLWDFLDILFTSIHRSNDLCCLIFQKICVVSKEDAFFKIHAS